MTIIKRGNTYHKRERQSGKDVQFALKTDDIEEAIRRNRDTEGLNLLPKVKDAIDRYESRPEGVKQTDRIYLMKLRKELGSVDLVDLSTGLIDELVTQRRLNAGLKPGSVRRELNTLGAVLNHARLYGLTKQEVKIRKPRVDDARTQWLTKQQRDDMIEIAAPKEFKALVAGGFYTGARIGELVNAKPSAYDEQRKILTVSTNKTGGKGKSWRQIPIHPVLADLMVSNDDWLFPAPRGKRWSTGELYRHWRTLVTICGHEDLRPHDMRHTFASLMVQAGVDLITIASITGHKSVTMLNRYSHLDSRTQANAIAGAL